MLKSDYSLSSIGANPSSVRLFQSCLKACIKPAAKSACSSGGDLLPCIANEPRGVRGRSPWAAHFHAQH